MATLHEYYLKDFSRLLCMENTWTINEGDKFKLKIKANTHLDFDSGAVFISFYIPNNIVENEVQIFEILLDNIEDVYKQSRCTSLDIQIPGAEMDYSKELKFTGKVFFYYEGTVNKEGFEQLQRSTASNNLLLRYRDVDYMTSRNKIEIPLAFISHDSRDKDLIARKLAEELQKRMCPVWYDEYSLKIGESLRESIEKGLKECKKCVLILSPNFLNNSGWTKTEFNTIFTREILEGKSLVLPVWAGASKKEIYDYSPTLVDKVGVDWNNDLDFVVSKLQQAILSEQ